MSYRSRTSILIALALTLAIAGETRSEPPGDLRGDVTRPVATANGPISLLKTPPSPRVDRPGDDATEDGLPVGADSVLAAPPSESRVLGRVDDDVEPEPLLAAAGATASTESGVARSLDMVRVLGALAGVIGLILLLRIFVRRGGGTLGPVRRPSGVLEVLARYPVGRGQQVMLLKVARRVLLVHQSGSAMTTLSEMTEPDEVAAVLSRLEAGAGRTTRAFKTALRRFEGDHRVRDTTARGATLLPGGEPRLVDLTESPHAALRRMLDSRRVEGENQKRRSDGATERRRGSDATALHARHGRRDGRRRASAGRGAGGLADLNPLAMLEEAAGAVPGGGGGLSGALNIVLLLTVLTLAPAIMILCTCFTRIVIVMGLLRQALGTQGLPPSQVVVGLSLFITFVVMTPTVERMYEDGIGPYMSGEIEDYEVAWDRAKQPLRDFMFAQLEATGNWSGLYMMLNYRGIDTSDPGTLTRADVDMLSLIPAYILSELKVAFLMGFRIYLPFLVIDMVIASMLISMGMLMLPPVLISLPFKLLLFVLVDGWQLVVETLLTSIATADPGAAASAVTACVLLLARPAARVRFATPRSLSP